MFGKKSLGEERMELNWARWFHCESSFGLLLVPSQPGIFALAEEVMQPVGENSRRMLAVFEVDEADDLSRAMSRLFATGSQWREKLSQARCYVRYAIAPGIADRGAAATALKNWLSSQREAAAQIFEKPLGVPMAPAQVSVKAEPLVSRAGENMPSQSRSSESMPSESRPGEELKTMAERAVDRVTHGMQLSKPVPAGF
jgi:hypothetical protein